MNMIFVTDKTYKEVENEAQTAKQLMLMLQLRHHFEALLSIDKHEHEQRRNLAFLILIQVCHAPEGLGAMSEEYLRRLFSYGERVLRLLEIEIGRLHGGRQVDFKALDRGPGKMKTTQKEKRHLRRDLLKICLGISDQSPASSMKRLNEFRDIVNISTGMKFDIKVGMPGGGNWKLPALRTLVKPTERKAWEDEMFWFCMRGLQGAAQCLSHRYMHWGVVIRDQKVPDTGLKVPEIKEWLAVTPEEGKELRPNETCLQM